MPADAIKQVKSIIKAQHKFWSQSRGWAPDDAANLLEIARLDRQLSFANTLGDYLIPFPYESADARQILGYTTLRSMCEGAIKLFVTVYLCDYRSDPGAFKDRKNSTLINPEDVKFDKLIEFYLKKGDHILRRSSTVLEIVATQFITSVIVILAHSPSCRRTLSDSRTF